MFSALTRGGVDYRVDHTLNEVADRKSWPKFKNIGIHYTFDNRKSTASDIKTAKIYTKQLACHQPSQTFSGGHIRSHHTKPDPKIDASDGSLLMGSIN
jgi:hypothetical protein